MTMLPPTGGFTSRPTFPYQIEPYTTGAPFTYRDAMTFLRRMENLVKYINTELLPWIDEGNAYLVESFNNAIKDIADYMEAQKAIVDFKITKFIELSNKATADFNAIVAQAKVDIDASVDLADEAREAAQKARNEAEIFAANTVALQDAAVTALLGNKTSTSRNAVNRLMNLLVMDGDTTLAQINAFLAEGGYRVLKGSATVDGALIIKSNTTLDASAATVVGVTGKNVLTNQAAIPSRTATAASVAGSATVTTTAATFTQADVGRRVQLLNAGPNAGLASAPGSLYGTVVAVNDATTAVVDTPAGLSTANQTLYIYNGRDKNIEIIGGTWNLANNNAFSQTQDGHGFRLRRIDKLILRNQIVNGTGARQVGGQYAISIGDVTNADTRTITFNNTNSDGIHFQGPVNGVTVRGITGNSTGDDLVAFTGVDGQSKAGSLLGDTEGDILNVSVAEIYGYDVWTHLKVTGGTAANGVYRNVLGFEASGIYGNATGGSPVTVTDYAGWTVFDGKIRNVWAVASRRTDPQVVFNCSQANYIEVDGVNWPAKNGQAEKGVVAIRGQLNRRVVVKNVYYESLDTGVEAVGAVQVECSRIGELVVDGTYGNDSRISNFGALILRAAVHIDHIRVTNHTSYADGGNGILWDNPGIQVDSIEMSNVYRKTGSLLNQNATAAVGVDFQASNCVGGSAWVIVRGGMNIYLSNCVQNEGSGAGIRLIGAGATPVVFKTVGCSRPAPMVSKDAAQSLRALMSVDVGTDPALLNGAYLGDMVKSNNTAHGAGQGIIINNGATWKNLYTGATANNS